CLQYNSVPPTF
nr:immunoglobulin light chain junction region [Macaca mulatta]MOW51819.1 immunoglobulin light chain junction region [Macaca mulatta]MOW51898.1 immunoglobulin light chain junction region [Macaca mulatta]MOW51902.1 immunoglobulin light chain junction region [Macaca mulatta]MOW51934.1 immunoglobulin light chain junction region [Macaca mulatta]